MRPMPPPSDVDTGHSLKSGPVICTPGAALIWAPNTHLLVRSLATGAFAGEALAAGFAAVVVRCARAVGAIVSVAKPRVTTPVMNCFRLRYILSPFLRA